MFCSQCGNPLDGQSRFCPKCGAPITNDAQPTPDASPAASAPFTPPTAPPSAPFTVPPMTPVSGNMKWFKFLIYFALWFGAVGNFLGGIMMFDGGQYGDSAKLVYAVYDGLKAVDIIVATLCIVLAAFGIYVRFRLAGFYVNGPKMLNLLYVFSALVNLLYIVGLFIILPSRVAENIGLGSYISSSVISVLMICLNTNYFKKRAHLFVNK